MSRMVKYLEKQIISHCRLSPLIFQNFGMNIRARMSATFDSKIIKVTFPGHSQSSSYHHIWLRDNCHCEQCYHNTTKQRLLNTFDIPLDIQPQEVSVQNGDRSKLLVTWPNEHKSVFEFQWLLVNSYNPALPKLAKDNTSSDAKETKSVVSHTYWDAELINASMPIVEYNDVMNFDEGVKQWINKTFIYGFCFVKNVPVDALKTKELIEKITFIKPTHYGGFWDFTSDLAVNDTAYTNIAIPLHTDGTYWSEAPGYQVFHLLDHKGTGGETSLTDAVRAAYLLKETYPQYFKLLSTMPVDFHSAGEEDVFLQPAVARPIIILDEEDEKVIQVRWNNLDRSVLKIRDAFKSKHVEDGKDLVTLFYEALKAFHTILEDPGNVIFHQLKPGEVLLFDNWRVLHSRTSFTGKRRMCGAYYTKDDFISRFKTINYDRKSLVDGL